MFKSPLTEVQSRLIFFLGSVIVLVAFLWRPEYDPDLFWHMTLGRDLLDFQISPYPDSHSFTFSGVSNISLPWIFECVSYFFYKNFGGWIGVRVLKGLFWILTVGLVTYYSSRRKIPLWLTFFYLSIITFQIVFSNALRAHTFTLAIYPLFLLYIYRLKEEWKWKQILGASLWLAVMTNWHHSSVLLYCLITAAFAERFLSLVVQRSKKVGEAVLQYLVVLLSGFANPSFYHPLWNYSVIDKEWGNLIIEMAPSGLEHHSVVSSGMFFVFGLISLFCLYRKKWFELFCFLGFGFQAFQYSRAIPMSLFLLTPIALENLSELLGMMKRIHIRSSLRYAVTCIICFIPILALVSVLNVYQVPYENSESDRRLPLNLKKEGQSLSLEGRVFSDYALSGWLMFYYPGLKVFIDGRAHTMYPVEHVRKYNNFGFAATRDWAIENWRQLKVDYVVGNFSPGNSFLRHAIVSGDFWVQWLSHDFVILSKKAPSFSSLSKVLFRPNCSDRIGITEIESDHSKATKLFGSESEISKTLGMLIDIRKVPEGKEALDEFSLNNEKLFTQSDFLRRVLAFEYRKRGFPKDTVALLLSLNSGLPMDTIYLLELARELNDANLAVSVIESALPGEWFYPDELQIISDTLSSMKSRDFSQPQKIEGYFQWLNRTPAAAVSRQSDCEGL